MSTCVWKLKYIKTFLFSSQFSICVMGWLTNAEKIRRFRNKRKDDVAYRNSESKCVEQCRKAHLDKMSEFEKEEYKIKAREWQRKCHAEKKARQENSNTTETSPPCASSTPLPNINPYSTKQSYGKAVARARKTLPMSPQKNLAVVAGLASHVGLNLETRMERNLKNLSGLLEEAKSAATDFFFFIHHARFKWCHNSLGWFWKEKA